MLQNSPLFGLIKDLPAILQYMVVIAIVLIILYVCLLVTRLIGKGRGEQIHYDNPEEYEKQVPDLFASTAFKRKKKAPANEDTPKKEQ